MASAEAAEGVVLPRLHGRKPLHARKIRWQSLAARMLDRLLRRAMHRRLLTLRALN
jgi:hypothetical protein